MVQLDTLKNHRSIRINERSATPVTVTKGLLGLISMKTEFILKLLSRALAKERGR